MSDLDWDSEDFDPLKTAPVPPKVTDKWEGEDEDDVRDNWDDEDEERERGENAAPPPPTTTKKKKKLSEIIAEKEAKQAQAEEKRRKEKEDVEKLDSPAEKLAEKIRIQKVKEEADLQIATELLGVKPAGDPPETIEEDEPSEEKYTPPDKLVSLDEVDLSNSENLENFRQSVINKIKNTDNLEKKTFFVTFIEDLLKDLLSDVELDDVKKISSVINALYNEKVKASKLSKGKKKATGKAKLNTGQGSIQSQDSQQFYGGFDDYDEFSFY